MSRYAEAILPGGRAMSNQDVSKLANQIKALEKQLRQMNDWKKSAQKSLDSQLKSLTELDKRTIDEVKRYNKTAQFLDQEKRRVDALLKRSMDDDAWKTKTMRFLDQEQKRMVALEKQSTDDAAWRKKTLQFLDQEQKRVGQVEKFSKVYSADMQTRTKHNNDQLVSARKMMDGLAARIAKLEKGAAKG